MKGRQKHINQSSALFSDTSISQSNLNLSPSFEILCANLFFSTTRLVSSLLSMLMGVGLNRAEKTVQVLLLIARVIIFLLLDRVTMNRSHLFLPASIDTAKINLLSASFLCTTNTSLLMLNSVGFQLIVSPSSKFLLKLLVIDFALTGKRLLVEKGRVALHSGFSPG